MRRGRPTLRIFLLFSTVILPAIGRWRVYAQ